MGHRSWIYARCPGVALALALALALGGCGNDAREATSPPDESQTTTRQPEPVSTSPADASASPSGPTLALLDWKPTDKTVENDQRGLTIRGKNKVAFDSPDGAEVAEYSPDRISEVLLDEEYAVVVAQDPQEERPGRASVEATAGKAFTVDESA
jgi:hypothetical protein